MDEAVGNHFRRVMTGQAASLPTGVQATAAIVPGHYAPEEQVAQQEEQAALLEAIDRLPEERRNLLHYKFATSLSNLEIGAMMNKSESAIKSLYFRTLAALRQDLEARGWGAGSPAQENTQPFVAPEPSTRSSNV